LISINSEAELYGPMTGLNYFLGKIETKHKILVKVLWIVAKLKFKSCFNLQGWLIRIDNNCKAFEL